MEAIIKNIVAGIVPYLVNFLMDNRHLLIDFLKQEAQKSDNQIDDYIVGVIADYINSL